MTIDTVPAEMFCTEMQQIKAILASLVETRQPGNDLYMQFPSNPAEMTLAAETTYKAYETTINRTLKFLSIDVPDGIIVSIYKDNELWAWATDDTGSMEFEGGIYFKEIRIEAKNTTKYPLRWSVKLAWG